MFYIFISQNIHYTPVYQMNTCKTNLLRHNNFPFRLNMFSSTKKNGAIRLDNRKSMPPKVMDSSKENYIKKSKLLFHCKTIWIFKNKLPTFAA